MERVDCLVIGAGVIGLAVARVLAREGRSVIIAEREPTFGSVTSSRNSEVIHAGIYYAPDSLKSRLCVRGRQALYSFCRDFAIDHRQCGKLIVACQAEEMETLRRIQDNAGQAGVTDLDYLDADDVATIEPEIACVGALFSPSTGIIDSHAFMHALLGDAERLGAIIVYRTEVVELGLAPDGLSVRCAGEPSPNVHARYVVNAAGLCATALAGTIPRTKTGAVPATFFAKGSYFTITGQTGFQHLIYPVPVPGGLGVHLTLDLAGRARFGPDVAWVDTVDYMVDARTAPIFLKAIQTYWPALTLDRLQPAYAGVRPKLSGPGQPDADFRIDGPSRHGVPGLINLFGIESPGLTASLAIAEEVARLVN